MKNNKTNKNNIGKDYNTILNPNRYSFWNILKYIYYKLTNIFISFMFYITLFIFMNICLFIFYPVSVILNILYNIVYIIFIIIFVYNGFIARECEYSYLPLSRFKKVLKFIEQVILDIICFILGTIIIVLIMGILNGIYIIYELICFFILLLGQSILWPIISTVKFYIDINKIIKGYWNGLVKENKLYNEYSKIQSKNLDNNNNYYNNTKKLEIWNYEKNNSLNLIHDIIDDTNKLIIPSIYFKQVSYSYLVFKIWKYRIKKIIISCISWNIISIYPVGLLFMMFPCLQKDMMFIKLREVKFLWWKKKTYLEHPRFY